MLKDTMRECARGREPVWAVIVARTGPQAKSRLAPALGHHERQSLALSMLDRVLATAARASWLAGVVAVVDTAAAEEVAQSYGAITERDAGDGHMNAAVSAGLAFAARRGAQAALVLPGDVPLVTADDLSALAEAARDCTRVVVVGTSRHGGGTNALFLRPWDVIGPAFGPPSVERHIALARAAGASAVRVDGLGLSLDIDTPEDLAEMAGFAL
ncbi:MAG: 2-phospho-L-lactate guanylyltransferase [Chloroflexota bacterium]